MTRALLVVAVLAAAANAQLAVRGEFVWTLDGPMRKDAVVLMRDGKITAIGDAATTEIPAGWRVLAGKHVTPGLIDARSVVGLAGAQNQPHDQDQLERSAPIQPELRALDAYNARETLVGWLRSFGVTTLHTGHAPGPLVSGQTMVVKTTGRSADADVVQPTAMIACTLGEPAAPGPVRGEAKPPGTRPKAVAMLREELQKAREYARKRADASEDKRPPVDLRLDALGRVLNRDWPLLVTAQREMEISAALRIAKEFELRLVLDGAAEGYLLLDELKAAGVPVIAHPPMARSSGALQNATMELPRLLAEKGIPFALQGGYESYVPKTRVVLFEAAVACKQGLPFERALAAITADAARVLGLDQRLGSLAPGRDADLAVYDGDPFEYVTHCIATVIDGKVVFEGKR